MKGFNTIRVKQLSNFFDLKIYTFSTKKNNHQVRKYQYTWDPRKKGLKKESQLTKSYVNLLGNLGKPFLT